MRDMGGADHDLRGHAADIYAGAADRSALDERDQSAVFGNAQRRCHGRSAAADDSHLQGRAPALRLGFSIEYFAVSLLGRCGGVSAFLERRPVTCRLHSGGKRSRVEGAFAAYSRGPFDVRHICLTDAGHVEQRILDMTRATAAGHAGDLQDQTVPVAPRLTRDEGFLRTESLHEDIAQAREKRHGVADRGRNRAGERCLE